MRSCARYRLLASGPEAAARTSAHNFGLDTVADYPARDDDRELQIEQTIVAPPVRKLQPGRMNALSWFGMTFAKKSTARSTTATARSRRISLVARRPGEGPLTEPTAATQPRRQEPLFMPLNGHRCGSERVVFRSPRRRGQAGRASDCGVDQLPAMTFFAPPWCAVCGHL